MKKTLLRRLALLPVLAIGVTLVAFSLLHLAPGDPARKLAGGVLATPQTIAQVRRAYGLNKPLPVQYERYLINLAKGNLGTSLTYQKPVGRLLIDRFPGSAELVVASLIISVPIGIWLGVAGARRRNTRVDHATTLVSLASLSIPLFWLALLLAYLFSVKLHVFPLSGRLPPFTQLRRITGFDTVDALLEGRWALAAQAVRYLALPAISLSIISIGIIARFTRASFIEALNQDYIQTARAYGISERQIVWKHASKNALLPLVTLFGVLVPVLFVAAVLAEQVFNWPGIGGLLVESMQARDYSVVEGVMLVLGLMFIVANAFVDVAYTFLDPRIRRS